MSTQLRSLFDNIALSKKKLNTFATFVSTQSFQPHEHPPPTFPAYIFSVCPITSPYMSINSFLSSISHIKSCTQLRRSSLRGAHVAGVSTPPLQRSQCCTHILGCVYPSPQCAPHTRPQLPQHDTHVGLSSQCNSPRYNRVRPRGMSRRGGGRGAEGGGGGVLGYSDQLQRHSPRRPTQVST